VSSLCNNPIPSDFCNYSLTKIRTFNFNQDFKLAKAFEMTFSDGVNTYECFDGLFSFALKHRNNTLADNQTEPIVPAAFNMTYSELSLGISG